MIEFINEPIKCKFCERTETNVDHIINHQRKPHPYQKPVRVVFNGGSVGMWGDISFPVNAFDSLRIRDVKLE